MNAIIDIDGTILDIGERRRLLPNMGEFLDPKAMRRLDAPRHDVCAVIAAIPNLKPVFLTGRGAHLREVSLGQIKQCFPNIKHPALYMRAEGDFRHDVEIKAELVRHLSNQGFKAQIAFEDRADISRLYRSMGITVFSVDWFEGEF